MHRITPILGALAVLSAPLHARDINVDSVVYQEVRSTNERTISATNELRRGDRVVTLLDWRSFEAQTVVMTTAVPRDLSFLNASAEGVEISTDGGRSWHATDSNAAGRVTHLRWRATPGRGRLTYSAIVR